mmetsp:Transcript_62601/g.111596  ORF Transcript_62601/g.111596 Transcript_62601/m.111596 type:complete len:240 (-) Transcript_62601:48-767(-)
MTTEWYVRHKHTPPIHLPFTHHHTGGAALALEASPLLLHKIGKADTSQTDVEQVEPGQQPEVEVPLLHGRHEAHVPQEDGPGLGDVVQMIAVDVHRIEQDCAAIDLVHHQQLEGGAERGYVPEPVQGAGHAIQTDVDATKGHEEQGQKGGHERRQSEGGADTGDGDAHPRGAHVEEAEHREEPKEVLEACPQIHADGDTPAEVNAVVDEAAQDQRRKDAEGDEVEQQLGQDVGGRPVIA